LHVKRLSPLGLSTSLLQHHKKGCFFADASCPRWGLSVSERGFVFVMPSAVIPFFADCLNVRRFFG
jgi:hypothetical protein